MSRHQQSKIKDRPTSEGPLVLLRDSVCLKVLKKTDLQLPQ
jgi:hypothetical protein